MPSEYTNKINFLDNKQMHLFAAANTYRGFVSFFEDIFQKSGLDKIYILKGGPGVGKSTLMKKAASKAEEKGYNPIYYHCSSDPNSLDGVVIPEKACAVLDGTAPHTFDPVYPAARDMLVDMGAAWDFDMLYQNRKSIIELSDSKSLCYKAAYRLLSAAKSTNDQMVDLASFCMNRRKLSVAAARIAAKHFIKNSNSKPKTFVTNALSCQGEVRYFSHEKQAETLYFVKDIKSTAGYFFDKLYEFALKSGADVYAGITPLCPEKISSLYFPDSSVSISLYDDNFCRELDKAGKTYKIINLARFFDAEKYRAYRGKYKFAEKCCQTLLDAACNELERAGKYHAELEKIYGKATDYNKIAQISDKVVADMLS